MSIALTIPVSRGTDPAVEVHFVGINYERGRVLVRLVYSPSGLERDFTFEGPSLTALRNNVSQFNGLKVALLEYLQTLASDLAGTVS